MGTLVQGTVGKWRAGNTFWQMIESAAVVSTTMLGEETKTIPCHVIKVIDWRDMKNMKTESGRLYSLRGGGKIFMGPIVL